MINEFPGKRVLARYADASDYESLVAAFKGVTIVIVASTTTKYVKQVAQAAIDVGIDYLDIHYQQNIVPILNALTPSIKEAGRCFITQAGFHPGLPSVFVRYAAPNFDLYKKAVISTAMNARIENSEPVYEILDEIVDWKPVKIRLAAEYNDAYYFTAIPVVACIAQYLDGSIVKPGLWMMGHVVDPVRLMNDMERMGIKIQMKVTKEIVT